MYTKKIILTVITTFVIISCNVKTADYYVEKGMECTRKKDYQCAVENYTFAIELDKIQSTFKNPTQLYVYRGNSYYFIKKYDDALADFNSALSIDDKNFDAYFWRGRTLYVLKKYDIAIADFNLAIKFCSNDNDYKASCYFWRGVAYTLCNKCDSAINDLKIAISLNDKNDNSTYYYSRGVAYNLCEKYNFAINDLNTAIKIDSTFDDYYYVRGKIYQKINLPDSALADFEKAAYLGNEKAIKELKKYEKER